MFKVFETVVSKPYLCPITGYYFPVGCVAFVEDEGTDFAQCDIHGMKVALPKNHLTIV